MNRALGLCPSERLRLRKQQVPFLDDTPMIGPPGYTGKELQNPRLRRCMFDPDTILFETQLGGGLDGFVWKVWFGDSGPFALKVFWDVAPPEFHHYYAAQRECQNAAILQMMQASVASAPVVLYDTPEYKEDAMANFYAFSKESCQALRELQSEGDYKMPEGMRVISSIPRMVQCYGWLKLSGSLFNHLPWQLRAPPIRVDKIDRSMPSDKEYTAIIFELVEDGENLPSIVEKVDDFMYHAGFGHTLSPLAKNWKSGVLLDHSDMVHFGGFGWKEERYGKRKASSILK